MHTSQDNANGPIGKGPGLGRRGFLRGATATAAVAAVGVPAAATPAHADEARWGHDKNRIPRDQISIQLYTLRDRLAVDFDRTLAALHDIGYTRVEHAGFVGRTATQFKAAPDAHGLVATSGHVGIPQPFDPTAWRASLADAHTLG